MTVLVTCKNEEDPLKNEAARVLTTLNINFQKLKGSLLRSPCSDLTEFRTHSYSYNCPNYLQESTRSDQNEGTRVLTTFSSLCQWEFFPDAQGQLTPQS